jgi:hypothetical protein
MVFDLEGSHDADGNGTTISHEKLIRPLGQHRIAIGGDGMHDPACGYRGEPLHEIAKRLSADTRRHWNVVIEDIGRHHVLNGIQIESIECRNEVLNESYVFVHESLLLLGLNSFGHHKNIRNA